jgi:cytoskeletal protein CcmA (bactofilin family)
MALWKESSKDQPATPEPPVTREIERPASTVASIEANRMVQSQPRAADSNKESVISAGLTIEGKIEGAGHVRIAGNFKGDVHVQGNLTIDPGARLTGGVRANTVIIGGELEGNIDAAARVELLQTGILNGDLKAGSLTVAAGSRMRGRAEFGWEEKGVKTTPGSVLGST